MTYDTAFDREGQSQEGVYSDEQDQRSQIGSERRQYTIKGIENETLVLMRSAARREGMKVGAWVSARLRSAAEEALGEKCAPTDKKIIDLLNFVHRIEEKRDLESKKLEDIQNGLAEIIRAQHSMMAGLLDCMQPIASKRIAPHE